MCDNIDVTLINKKVLHPGKKYIPMPSGTRVKFHFQTRNLYTNTILDDSRKIGHPMELVLGKKFKLEVWEVLVQKMALGEVSVFTVDKNLLNQYPFVSKTLRDVGKGGSKPRHCCSVALLNEGFDYKDLDDLFRHPSDLEFTVELISVELPKEYQKENWQMTDDERLVVLKKLREEGNRFYRSTKYEKASDCYREALLLLENLMLKEKPHDTDWLELAALKIPLLNNYAQCCLLDEDFYQVIKLCTEVLQLDENNEKALHRRAKAHFGAWNPIEARADFQRLLELNPKLNSIVQIEVKKLDNEQHLRDLQDKIRMQKLF